MIYENIGVSKRQFQRQKLIVLVFIKYHQKFMIIISLDYDA